jgi:hypothetical protein
MGFLVVHDFWLVLGSVDAVGSGLVVCSWRPRGGTIGTWRLVKPCGLGLSRLQLCILENTFKYLCKKVDHNCKYTMLFGQTAIEGLLHRFSLNTEIGLG